MLDSNRWPIRDDGKQIGAFSCSDSKNFRETQVVTNERTGTEAGYWKCRYLVARFVAFLFVENSGWVGFCIKANPFAFGRKGDRYIVPLLAGVRGNCHSCSHPALVFAGEVGEEPLCLLRFVRRGEGYVHAKASRERFRQDDEVARVHVRTRK